MSARGGIHPAYAQVELIVEHGPGLRTEDEAVAIVEKARGFARRHGLAEPFVEDYEAGSDLREDPCST